MADPVWGLLAKAQDDDKLIDTAISDAIATHEADPDAHTGAGESLETHKSQEVIDHPAYSVIDDKTKIDKFLIQSWFESLDGFSLTGSPWSYLGYLEVPTTTTLNNIAEADLPADDQFILTPDKTKSPIFESVVAVVSNGNLEGRTGMGEITSDNGIGFKFSKTKVYYMYFDGDTTEHAVEVAGVNPAVLHKYRIEITWETTIKWYIDNVLVATLDLTANQISLSTGHMFKFWIKNLTAGQSAKIMSYRALFQQDLI